MTSSEEGRKRPECYLYFLIVNNSQGQWTNAITWSQCKAEAKVFLVLPMHFSNILVTENIISEYFNMICFISLEFPGSLC